MEDIFIVGAARTAIGKFGGSLAGVPAARLGAHVIRKALERAGVAPDQVSEVIMGQVLTAAVGKDLAEEFVRLKRMEWVEYSRHVSAWEVERYLEFF